MHAARENCEQIDSDIEKVKVRIEGPKAKLMGLHEKLAGLKVEKNDLDDNIEEEEAKWSDQEQEVLAKKEGLDRLKQDLKGIQQQLKMDTQSKNSLGQEVRLLREQVEEARSEDSGEVERRQEQRKLVIRGLEEDKKVVEGQIEDEGVTREDVDARVKEDSETEQRIVSVVRGKKEQLVALRKEVEEMSGAGEQHLAVFGTKIPLVDRALKTQASRFQRPPIGPVGQHVKLRGEAAGNTELSRLIETELGRPQVH